MKQVIMLENGARVEIDGANVKHIGIDGNILYDSIEESYVEEVTPISHFFLISESEREMVRKWLSEVKPSTKRQWEFVDRVKKAISKVNYDYMISTLEPSLDGESHIFYEEGHIVKRELSFRSWMQLASEFYSDERWHSELATLYEGDLFKSYRIAMGYWTIEYVCDNSSSMGNYWDSPDPTHTYEASGARLVGGFRDGVGNTSEIYQTTFGFAIVGGSADHSGSRFPVARVRFDKNPKHVEDYGSGVIVLKRNN